MIEVFKAEDFWMDNDPGINVTWQDVSRAAASIANRILEERAEEITCAHTGRKGWVVWEPIKKDTHESLLREYIAKDLMLTSITDWLELKERAKKLLDGGKGEG